jgi:hypothetical protein
MPDILKLTDFPNYLIAVFGLGIALLLVFCCSYDF